MIVRQVRAAIKFQAAISANDLQRATIVPCRDRWSLNGT